MQVFNYPGEPMYPIFTHRIVFPALFLIISIFSGALYTLTGQMTPPTVVLAANTSNEKEVKLEVPEEPTPVIQQSAQITGDCLVSKRYPDSIRQWCGLITHYAQKHALQPDLVAALIWQESGGNAVAYSKSGAVGLMQVMPKDGIAASFQCTNGPCFKNRPSITQLQDAEFNIAYGTRMLSGLQSKYGNLRDALKYYGPMDVGYYYADKVLGIYQSYRGQ
jgi:hypothetical protein